MWKKLVFGIKHSVDGVCSHEAHHHTGCKLLGQDISTWIELMIKLNYAVSEFAF